MGNQASRVLATNNKKKAHAKSTKQQRRSSTMIVSQGNYDWLDQDPHGSNENIALDAAVSAAVALQQKKKQSTQLSQSVPAPIIPISSPPPIVNNTRRKSISEFFARRKLSLVSLHPTIIEEDMREFDRLQRLVNFFNWLLFSLFFF